LEREKKRQAVIAWRQNEVGIENDFVTLPYSHR